MLLGSKNFRNFGFEIVCLFDYFLWLFENIFFFVIMTDRKDDSFQTITVLASQSYAISASSHTGLSSSSISGISSFLWVLDSGASHHMSLNLSSFVYVSLSSSLPIVTADGTLMLLLGVGSFVTSC